ncbi:MAG: hypothetical protein UT15_C0002G0062 [Berkelbacteria bacterium GW2011_GWA1_39_10]|uniref:Uncharacterized protein n=1 Tax=Berkelbacteria bacterium GW2011_GWA1_39_10 TaxID=1618332 RepID=A0A0G0NYP5_9BACT|nr:MAG: hypothetical protein UT15_C0002G0062 [Berkelbacteria bacterium GW2011_GWA1_39_10]
MKQSIALLTIFLSLIVFSNVTNVARNQKQTLVTPSPVVNKSDIKDAEVNRYNNKYQIQVNYDVNSITEKLNWITQNELAK